MISRWVIIAAGIVAVALLFLVPAQDARRQVALLEKLAPKIERAHLLTPDTQATISRLVQSARLRTPGDQLIDVRRQAAIDRVADALQNKQVAQGAGNVGLRSKD